MLNPFTPLLRMTLGTLDRGDSFGPGFDRFFEITGFSAWWVVIVLIILGFLIGFFRISFFGPFDLNVSKIWKGLLHALFVLIFGPFVIPMFNIAVMLYFDEMVAILGA